MDGLGVIEANNTGEDAKTAMAWKEEERRVFVSDNISQEFGCAFMFLLVAIINCIDWCDKYMLTSFPNAFVGVRIPRS